MMEDYDQTTWADIAAQEQEPPEVCCPAGEFEPPALHAVLGCVPTKPFENPTHR